MWGEARFGGTFGVEVGLPARGDMRILHVKSYRLMGLAASVEMRIFSDWWEPLCSCTHIVRLKGFFLTAIKYFKSKIYRTL